MLPPVASAEISLLSRSDLIVFTGLTIGAYWAWQRRMPSFVVSRTWPPIVALTCAALALTEWSTLLGPVRATGASAGAAFPQSATVRGLIFTGAAVIVATLLRHGSQLARFHHRLRTRVQREHRARKAQATAERASRAKSDFLVHATHELRTPLNALLASAEFLARTTSDSAQRAHATTIVNEAIRLRSTANDVLDLRRIEEGRLTLEHVPFAPGEIARDIADLFALPARQKALELRLETHVPTGLLVGGDPRRFRQVLTTLVDNAITFTDRGSITLAIGFAAPDAVGHPALISVRVRDTGIGMSAELCRQLTRGFSATDPNAPAGAESGPGLGLAIAHRLVALMGGQLLVESAPHRGSEFMFTLAMPPIVPAKNVLSPAPAATSAVRRPRVLIVDDLAANRVMLEMFLERQGFAVEQARDGAEAIAMAKRQCYDAILMDVQMPTIDGYVAAREIRAAEPPEHRTLILAVTACVGSEAREKCLAAGMDEHITKPIDLRKFCRTLTLLLAARSKTPVAPAREAAPRFSRERVEPQLQTAR